MDKFNRNLFVRHCTLSELDRLSYIENWTLPNGEESISDLLSGDLFSEGVLDFVRSREEARNENAADKTYLDGLTTRAVVDAEDRDNRITQLNKLKADLNSRTEDTLNHSVLFLNVMVSRIVQTFADYLLDLGLSRDEVTSAVNAMLKKLHSYAVETRHINSCITFNQPHPQNFEEGEKVINLDKVFLYTSPTLV